MRERALSRIAAPVVADLAVKRVELRGAAREVMRSRAPEVLLAGAAGTGKSFVALLKVHLMMLANPGARGLMVRKTHRSLAATGLVTFREQVAKEAIERGLCVWYGGSGEKPAHYVYENGSVLLVGGMDNPEKIMSLEIDLAYVQEATELTMEDWEKLGTRLRNGVVSFQQLLADCNPQQPSHWLKKRCDEGRTQMLHSRHEDNPRLFDIGGDGRESALTAYGQTYMARLDALTGVRKERLRWGRWAAAEGLIYEGWRPELHLSDRKKMSSSWDRIWSVDFGYTHPFVWQMWAVDPDGRLWLEREIYQSQRLVEDHARQILKTVTYVASHALIDKGETRGLEWKYPKPRAILCDHDAEDRATLERKTGLGTIAATKTVSDGIQALAARLKPAGDGLPRLMVLRDSLVERDEELAALGRPLGFAQEIEGYIWQPPSASGRPAKDQQPLKERDDSMDAARYAVAHLDLAARGRMRWM